MIVIGVLANTFEGGVGALAGGHVHFIEVAKRWSDYDVRVFAPAVASETIARELPAATFIAMPSGDRVFKNQQLRRLYRTLAGIRRWRELRRCDVLVATSHFLPDVLPALAAAPRRTIVSVHHVLTSPDKRPGNKNANRISTAFEALSFSLIRSFAAAVFVYTRDVADYLRLEPGRTQAFLMSNGANRPVRTARLDEARRGAVYLGRLVPTKGVDDLLRAWALVRACGVVEELVIAGLAEPAYMEHLVALVRELGIGDSVHFRGSVSEAEKSAMLHAARVFVFASKEEGWGIVLAEAMMHGAPCLTYDLRAYRDIFIRGRVSVALGDIEAFAGQLRRLLTDDAFARDLATEASTLAARFTWESAANLELVAVEHIVRSRTVRATQQP